MLVLHIITIWLIIGAISVYFAFGMFPSYHMDSSWSWYAATADHSTSVAWLLFMLWPPLYFIFGLRCAARVLNHRPTEPEWNNSTED